MPVEANLQKILIRHKPSFPPLGDRAEYGKRLLEYLSEQLTAEFGKGFDKSNLRKMR